MENGKRKVENGKRKVENGKRKDRKHHLRTGRNQTDVRLDYLLLGVILLMAAVLRLWRLGQVPFMHDEFSALFRLRFDSFRDLIEQGVKIDGHPAGVQVFLYYWTRLVGWNEFWVKLPFALMGIGSVFLIYLIGKQWFNSKVGLFSAAFFAASQLTVFYSQIARPYAAGLFFVLLMTYFWNKILFDAHKPSVGLCIGFAISTWLAAMAHNFSTAQAGLIFFTGLFFLKKERRTAYWLSGLGAVLLYAPNFPIFYHQLFVNGGIGGWLGKPETTFLTDFLQYTMNYAPLFMFAAGLLIVLPFILGRQERRKRPIRWAAFAWFVIIFALAFTYSLVKEPIIQYSTLIFCYPFVVMAAFSWHKNNTMTMKQTVIAVLVLLFIGVSTLIVNRRHYDLMYHQGYDQIALRMQHDSDSLQDIGFATFTESAKVPEFYQAKTKVNNRIIFDHDNNIADFNQWLGSSKTPYLGFGWTDYADPVWETQAVAHYPWQLHEDTWFTSRYLTLSKNPVPGASMMLREIQSEPEYLMGTEYGKPQYIYCDSIYSDLEILGVVATIHANDTVRRCLLVMELYENETDSLLLWHGSSYTDGLVLPGINKMAAALRFNEKQLPSRGKHIKTYLWNPDQGVLTQVRTDYYVTRHNPRLTGVYDPLSKIK